MTMESISKALAIIGTIGVVCGIMIGLSALLLIIRPKAD
jgi:hypothetical protein